MTGLADCNNFFVSCERTLDRSLEGRAVVVLSNNDGCVVARSNEAKRLGIPMGEPAFRIRDKIDRGEVIALSGNHLLYREISIRIHNIFRRYAPATLDYSVDEAFLLMDGIPVDALAEIGNAINKACWEEEHIPVTIGFAPTKTLAKIATERGKKSGRSVIVLSTPEECEAAYADMPVGELWGVGRRLNRRLISCGVYTIGDLAARPLIWIRSNLGVTGERSWRELHGEPCIDLDHVDRSRQDSVSESRTFPVDIDDFDYLRARIAIYCAHVTKKMRSMDAECGELSVFLQTNRFHTEHGFASPSASVKFDPRTADSALITRNAIAILEHIYSPRLAYKRAGVILSDLAPTAYDGPSLFDEDQQEYQDKMRSRKLMKVLDALNSGPGPHTVKLASQLTLGHPGHNDGYSSSFGAPSNDKI